MWKSRLTTISATPTWVRRASWSFLFNRRLRRTWTGMTEEQLMTQAVRLLVVAEGSTADRERQHDSCVDTKGEPLLGRSLAGNHGTVEKWGGSAMSSAEWNCSRWSEWFE